MNTNELNFQAYFNHKFDRYRQEADIERLLHKSRCNHNEQSPDQVTSHPLLGRTLHLLRSVRSPTK